MHAADTSTTGKAQAPCVSVAGSSSVKKAAVVTAMYPYSPKGGQPMCGSVHACERTCTTQGGNGMSQLPSPTLPPPAWKLMTACTLRSCLCAFLNSSMYALKSYCWGPWRSQMPHLYHHVHLPVTFCPILDVISTHWLVSERLFTLYAQFQVRASTIRPCR